eukprot:g903.t1
MDSASVASNFMAGLSAGTLTAIVGQPLDTLKVRLQTGDFDSKSSKRHQRLSTFGKIGHILKNEGVRSLYRGSFAPLFAQSISGSFIYGIVFTAKQWMEHDHHANSEDSSSSEQYSHDPLSKVALFSYLLSASTETAIYTPLELIKVRAQIDPKATIVSLMKKVYQNKGIKGFYTGARLIWLRESFGNVVHFSSYFYAKQYFSHFQFTTNSSSTANNHNNHRSKPPPSNISIALAGVIANFSYWLFIYPLDTLKANAQAASEGSRTTSSILRSPVMSSSVSSSDSSLSRHNTMKVPVTLSSSSSKCSAGGTPLRMFSSSPQEQQTTIAWSQILRLYKGITPTLLRSVPVGLVSFLCFENIAPPIKAFLQE